MTIAIESDFIVFICSCTLIFLLISFVFIFFSNFFCFHFFNIVSLTADVRRFSIMRVEINRLVSFQRCRNIEVSRSVLAETGCYYLGPGDRVKCYFCHVEIMNWSPGDDEVVEHIRYSSGCPLLNNEDTDNIAVNEGKIFFHFTFYCSEKQRKIKTSFLIFRNLSTNIASFASI